MALNKNILKKIESKTKNDELMRSFLVDIIQFESQNKGWYEKEYVKLLEKYCEEIE